MILFHKNLAMFHKGLFKWAGSTHRFGKFFPLKQKIKLTTSNHYYSCAVEHSLVSSNYMNKLHFILK